MNYHNQCILCNSTDIKELKKYRKHYLVKCKKCSFVFSNRIPEDDELQQHYATYQRNAEISSITIKRYEELLNILEKYRKTNTILDIGCGDGHFLNVAKQKGWNVYGTEFTDEAVNVCTQKGINCFKGRLSELEFNTTFDVITSFEVIEHIYNPVEEINIISKLLRKGGGFYLTTPNFTSLTTLILQEHRRTIEYPEHLSYYTPQTLHYLLSRQEFKKIFLKTDGIDIADLKKYFFSNKTIHTNTNATTEAFREMAESNRIASYTKKAINFTLNIFRLGDSIKCLYEKE